jgi:uncharacterized protein YndB with AHSA1/START domain
MTQTISIAPVRKSVRVEATQTRAFEVFTAKMGSWWPRQMKLGSAPLKTVVVEGRLGGRWYEVGEDGAEAILGQVLAWEPPRRLVVSWAINHRWKPDATVSAEVEITFIADGPNATIVDVEHRKFEQMGVEGGTSIRRDVDRGWPVVLEHFRSAAES